LRLAQDVGDCQAEFLAQRLLAIAQAHLADHRQGAIASAERALTLARELGEPAFEHETLHTVAHVNNMAGRHHVALRFSQEGLDLAQGLGLQTAVAEWLGISGDAYQGLGRYREAAESLSKALPIYRNHSMHRYHALCLLKMGYAYQAMGNYQDAIRYLTESLGMFDQLQLGHYAERARQTLIVCQDSQRAALDQRPRV
jgi:tetratricopeptide (TPR) repeat protein